MAPLLEQYQRLWPHMSRAKRKATITSWQRQFGEPSAPETRDKFGTLGPGNRHNWQQRKATALRERQCKCVAIARKGKAFSEGCNSAPSVEQAKAIVAKAKASNGKGRGAVRNQSRVSSNLSGHYSWLSDPFPRSDALPITSAMQQPISTHRIASQSKSE